MLLSPLALRTTTGKDDTRLLTYWVVFSFLNVIEFWSSAILYWIPSYFLVKTFFLIYLSSPVTNGAEKVYKAAIKPLSDKLIPVDAATSTSEAVGDLLNKVQEKTE
ncbi:unnamed protein product [Ambrosiozyma monospora]|uniref:Unnamed protein product n=1 Tax=Ambrosiozyma monospora TaxID=43982 RepID=A0ACB5TQ30_AMBMO|nr:unnamed protein product [Ambrosiozyma monospora]